MGVQSLLRPRLAAAASTLDIQTGGGEVLAGVGGENFPPTLVATEGWPPNVARATALLQPLGALVVADPDEPPLPFADAAFDLVSSRHPATVLWSEIARVLKPGGTYVAQHVGDRANVEITEYFLGPFEPSDRRHHDVEAEQASAAGWKSWNAATSDYVSSFSMLELWCSSTEGHLDGPRLHRGLLPPTVAGSARPDRTRRSLPIHDVSHAVRGPQAFSVKKSGDPRRRHQPRTELPIGPAERPSGS